MPPFPRLTTRPFSILARVRAIARQAEPHPFERYPATQKAAPADWGRYIRRVGDTAKFYFPGFALFLGWPLVMEKVRNGHV